MSAYIKPLKPGKKRAYPLSPALGRLRSGGKKSPQRPPKGSAQEKIRARQRRAANRANRLERELNRGS